MAQSESTIANSWSVSRVLENGPSIVALLSASALVLSVVFQIAYFTVADPSMALWSLNLTDFINQTAIAVAISLLLFVPYAGCMLAGYVRHQRPKPSKNRPKFRRFIQYWMVEFLFALMWLVIILRVYFTQWSGFWAIVCYFVAGMQFLLFSLRYELPRFLGITKDHTQMLVVILMLAPFIASVLGAYGGLSAYICKRQVEIAVSGHHTIRGQLMARLDRGVIVRSASGMSETIYPWSQIERLTAGGCAQPVVRKKPMRSMQHG